MIEQRADYYNLQLDTKQGFVVQIVDKDGKISSPIRGIILLFDDYFQGDGWRKHLVETKEFTIKVERNS